MAAIWIGAAVIHPLFPPGGVDQAVEENRERTRPPGSLVREKQHEKQAGKKPLAFPAPKREIPGAVKGKTKVIPHPSEAFTSQESGSASLEAPSSKNPAGASAVGAEAQREEPAEEASKRQQYAVQVATFRDVRDAERLAEALREDGYESRVVSSEGWHWVLVGEFSSLEKANRVKQEIAREHGLSDAFLINS